ncbi:MAG: aminotransferase class V-fold PLP-dependent enzyme [Candidatus Eremiobacteraeota bacterium]|nr:aminotransferase class V-fold PLP-dependent enzyme [Candidatus Eremiobacteraeota bacterium]MBC5826861.1 aminotransferase class V-fold PLP-dependent enzyme [Candidatus Eremiobacteraeota bacterium]
MPAVEKIFIPDRRGDFPILSSCTYLISNSLGAMPARTRERLGDYADDWATLGVVAWDRWLALVNRTAELIGSLINAPPGSMALQQNVSVTQSILISCLDFTGARNKVVYSDLNFPTVHYNWMAQRARGARVEIVKSRDGITVDTQAMCEAIDESTLAVPISHVLFKSAYLQDVAAIVEKAHRVGAMVFLDIYQSVGVLPVDVRALEVDAAVGGCLKWLCGGPGTAFLYVSPDAQARLVPSMVGWFSHKRPFDFDMQGLDFADDAWRYAGGTPNPVAYYAALSGLEIINEVGIESIRARNVELTRFALERALQQKLHVNSPKDAALRGGHITVDFPGSKEASDELIKRRFIVDHRPGAGIRVAPHFYNTADEIAGFFAELGDVIDGL